MIRMKTLQVIGLLLLLAVSQIQAQPTDFYAASLNASHVEIENNSESDVNHYLLVQVVLTDPLTGNWIGITGGEWAILTGVVGPNSMVAYLPEFQGFEFFGANVTLWSLIAYGFTLDGVHYEYTWGSWMPVVYGFDLSAFEWDVVDDHLLLKFTFEDPQP